MTRRTAVGLAVAGLVAVLLVVAVVVVAVSRILPGIVGDPRPNLDVKDDFAPFTYLVEEPSEIRRSTEAVCSGLRGCNQAAESAHVRLIRFDNVRAARAHAITLAPYGWHSDYFVVEFLQPETTEPQDYEDVALAVDGVATDSPD